MARPVRPAMVAIVLVLSMAAASGVVTGADGGPTIAMSVNGDDVPHGERVVVQEANLTIRVTDDAPLETVVLRVRGDEIASYSPDGSAFERTLDEQTLGEELSARDNTIQVIATNANDQTESRRITIYKDTVPPKIGLSSPITVEPGYVFPRNVTDVGVNITLAGSVRDASTVTDFEAVLIADGHSRYASLEADGTFSMNTTLALGNTSLRIRASDEFGNERIVRTRFYVEDEEEPTIEVENWPENTTADSFTARVHATDDVGVESLTVRPMGQTEQRLLESPPTLLDRGRDDVVRNVTIELRRPGILNVTFNVTDMGNHSTELEKSIVYDPITPEEAAVPDIVVHNDSSGFLDDETYALDATIRNGSVKRVVLEAESVPGRDVSAYSVVFDGNATDRIAIHRNVSVEPGVTDLTIRVTDEFDNVHERTIRIDSREDEQELTPTTTTTVSTGTSTAGEATPTPVATVTAQTESALEPVTETSLPLLPGVAVIGILVAIFILGFRSKRQ